MHLKKTRSPKLHKQEVPPQTGAQRTLPSSLDFPDIDVQKAFGYAVIGDLESDRKSNASLDAETVAALAHGIISRDSKMVKSHFISRATFFRAEYTLRSKSEPPCQIFVNVTNCINATTAQRMMVDYLSKFQAAVQEVTKKAENQLGQVALQSDTSVFWVRDALWLQIIAEYDSAEALIKMIERRTAPRRRLLSFDGPWPQRNKKPIITMLLDFATKLDNHLAQSAVSPSEHKKPKTAVNMSSFHVVCGQSFSVKLCDTFDIHESRWAEVEDSSLVMQTANKDPNAIGEYTFFARNTGSTNLKLIVVRADNLAIDTAEVQVEIAERGVSEANENTDLESWRKLDELLATTSDKAKST